MAMAMALLPSTSLPSFRHQNQVACEITTYKFSTFNHMRPFGHADLGYRTSKNIIMNGTAVEGGTTQKPKEESHYKSGSGGFNADVAKLCGQGRLKEALGILHVMNLQAIPVDSNIYATLLEACTNLKALKEGKRVHSHIASSRIEEDELLGDKLVTMYAKCGSLVDARLVFDTIPKQNAFLWNVMIGAYVKHGHCEEAVVIFYEMQRAGVKPDEFTFTCVLKACAGFSAVQQGKEIHDYIIRSGFDLHVFVGNALVSMYAKCRSIEAAQRVFDKIPQRNVVSWNAMIAAYVQNENSEKALELFRQMQFAGTLPDSATMSCVIPVCTRLSALQQGKEMHAYVIRNGFKEDLSVVNSLIDMYAKCGNLTEALQVFENMSQRNVVSWTVMLAGYAWNGYCVKALELFYQMQLAGVMPDVVTITSVLSVCAQLEALQQGKDIHDYVIRNGFDSGVSVGNALMDMYAKCQSMETVQQVFDKMSQRDVISWNTIITGCSQNGQPDEALKYFRQMQLTMKPNPVTIACVLPACASLAALQQGKEIHGHLARNGLFSDVFVGNALIDMYAKCGSIKDARQLFDNLSQRDSVSWTIMIAGYGMHGYGQDALLLFDQMQQAGFMPDHFTFIAVLCACSHAGLVDEGWQFFNLMSRECHITPKLEHYACMVDLLGRAGCLDEAYDFVNEMPLEPDAGVWGALLNACRIHRNIELGKCVADRVLDLEPENAGYYVLLSNIYAEAGRWDAVAKVRKKMNARGLKKNPGCSWVVVRNRVHAFLVGDRSHPQAEKIYAMLESLAGRMKEEGYVPDTNFVLREVEDEVKGHILCGHSEKLAIAFALISTGPGTPIRITKNLRVCGDCHSATKIISKIVRREITLRDASRFHHFKDGHCSCRDYW
eukprot:Gb_27880 [translate_table: standard]